MATIVGLAHLELDVVQARSLKDKRRVVRGFKDRTAHRHNVSVAEVDEQHHRRRCVLAIAMVANDRRYVESVLQQVVHAAAAHRDMILLSHEVEYL